MWMKLIGKDLEEYKIPRCEIETPCRRQKCLEKPNFSWNVSTCLTNLLVKKIYIFQRGVIKKMFNIHWQDKITNVELYRR